MTSQYITKASGRLVSSYNAVGLPTLSAEAKSTYTRVVITVERGPIRVTTDAAVNLSPDGYEGSSLKQQGAVFNIHGSLDMANFKFVTAILGKQAAINYRYEGRGA